MKILALTFHDRHLDFNLSQRKKMYPPELIRKEALRQGLRANTIQTYCRCVEKFFRTCRKEPCTITKRDIQDYLDRLLERKAPGSTINVYLNALKFFYEQVLHRRLTINIKFSKTRKRLPDCLSKEEAVTLFTAIPNPIHRFMVRFLYSSGLRVSEFCHLRVRDLQLDSNFGWVRDGKGGKDRPFVIARSIKEELQRWIENNTLTADSWLFPGYKGKPYSYSSIREILWAARKKAEIRKRVHPHLLRHSFATHCIMNGYSPLELQPLLGHSRLDTTMVYVHTAAQHLLKVQSPLDSLPELEINLSKNFYRTPRPRQQTATSCPTSHPVGGNPQLVCAVVACGATGDAPYGMHEGQSPSAQKGMHEGISFPSARRRGNCPSERTIPSCVA